MRPSEAKGILHHTAYGLVIAKGVLRREAQLSEGQDAWVDDQLTRSHIFGIVKRSLLPLEAEEVPGLEGDGTQLVCTAAGRPKAIPAGHALIPSKGEDTAQNTSLRKGADVQMAFQKLQGAREVILSLQPGEGQEFAVGYLNIQGSLITEEEMAGLLISPTTKAAPVADPS